MPVRNCTAATAMGSSSRQPTAITWGDVWDSGSDQIRSAQTAFAMQASALRWPDASGGVNITKIGRFENHYVFLSKPMVDDRALQSDERDARVIMPRWDFATFMQMQPNGRACAQ
jgi:hypothetical protein